MAQKIPFFELFTDFSPDFDLRVPLNAAMVTNMVLEPEKRTMTLDMTVRAEMTDSTRETAPLKPAEDAVRIDSTDLTVDEVCDAISELIAGARA